MLRLRRSNAELQRVIAQLDQIERKSSPAGMSPQQRAQLDARRNQIRAWLNSLLGLSVKLSRLYVGPAWPSRSELNATIRAVEHARYARRERMILHPLNQREKQLLATLSAILKLMYDTLYYLVHLMR